MSLLHSIIVYSQVDYVFDKFEGKEINIPVGYNVSYEDGNTFHAIKGKYELNVSGNEIFMSTHISKFDVFINKIEVRGFEIENRSTIYNYTERLYKNDTERLGVLVMADKDTDILSFIIWKY